MVNTTDLHIQYKMDGGRYYPAKDGRYSESLTNQRGYSAWLERKYLDLLNEITKLGYFNKIK